MKGKKLIILIALIIIVILALVVGRKFLGTKGTNISNNQTSKSHELKLDKKLNINEKMYVSPPKLMAGMTPIKWDSAGKVVETTADDTNWYDYKNKQWANAKTLDGSMWVWIPRFAYMIDKANYHTSKAGEIQIKFLKDNTDVASDGTKKWDNVSGAGKWNIPPAFDFGGPIAGFWVAKFEASATDGTSANVVAPEKLQVKPGVASWNEITISNVFDNCKGAKYGGTANLCSHLMKNSEWGAVAYLAQSKYGKNSEITINSNSNHITGGETGNAYATTNIEQSTTGNVTGIYDMSGGAWEYVAGYIDNGHSYLRAYGASLVNEKDGKYKDVYKIGTTDDGTNNYAINSNRFGDAIYETSTADLTSSNWYDDAVRYPNKNATCFTRGAGEDYGTDAGLFCLFSGDGATYSMISFRPVLTAI